MKTNSNLILGIDTSCDETSVAIVDGTKILANIISSQIELHRKYGGVVPMIAKREHQERIDAVISEAFRRAGRAYGEPVTWKAISTIAVTYGPGLAIALEVGISKAKELCQKYHKKLIAVNHMEGHLWSALALNSKGNGQLSLAKVKFPVLGVLISGGHSEFILVKGFNQYEIVGETLDDALGEAYDKVARLLGLGYPGGAVLSSMAKLGNAKKYNLPIPMAKDKSFNLSYSGLKTAMVYLVKNMLQGRTSQALTKQEIVDLAASFEKAAIAGLVKKMALVLEKFKVKMVLVGGGVSASVKVRREIRKICANFGLQAYFPRAKSLYMDNGAMIAIAGLIRAKGKKFSNFDLDRDPKARLGN